MTRELFRVVKPEAFFQAPQNCVCTIAGLVVCAEGESEEFNRFSTLREIGGQRKQEQDTSVQKDQETMYTA